MLCHLQNIPTQRVTDRQLHKQKDLQTEDDEVIPMHLPAYSVDQKCAFLNDKETKCCQICILMIVFNIKITTLTDFGQFLNKNRQKKQIKETGSRGYKP